MNNSDDAEIFANDPDQNIDNEENRRFYIYKYTSPSNKVYIGQTCQTREQRAGRDGRQYRGCTHFYNAIQKYGYNNFKYEVVESGLTATEADEREKYWISYYNSCYKEYGYNISSGGQNKKGEVLPETRKKLSEALKGKNHLTHEQAIELSSKGVEARRKNGFYVSPETRKKMSDTRKKLGLKPSAKCHEAADRAKMGKPRSDETKKKISEALKGRVIPQEQRQKISQSGMGRQVSEETRRKIGQKQGHPVAQYSLCGVFINAYYSTGQAAKETGACRSSIINCCNGKRNKTFGYKWRYISNEEYDAFKNTNNSIAV